MRQRCRGLLVARGGLVCRRVAGLSRFASLRRGERFPRAHRLVLVRVSTVGISGGGGFRAASLMAHWTRCTSPGGLAHTAFPSGTAATMAAAAAAPAATTPLAALATIRSVATLRAIACQRSSGLDAAARLRRGRHSCTRAWQGLRASRSHIPLAPVVIPVVLTPITIAIPIASVTAAPLCTSAFSVAAALAAFRAAGLPGMLPPAIAASFAAARRAIWRSAGRRRGRLGCLRRRHSLRSLRLAREDLFEPCAQAAIGMRLSRGDFRCGSGRGNGRRLRDDRSRSAR